MKKKIKDHNLEEQELIVNYSDPMFRPLLHGPDCISLKEKALDGHSGFAEAKAEYKKEIQC
jgi:hypothetical protein